ncbi:MAG: uroporphyrinogen decarboxylase [Candidatus Krumholzibacteriia bacterium]
MSDPQAENLLLRACRRRPVDRRPVWFMRQAGRYMKEYRAIKERASFLEMCKTPDLAVEITLQPVRALGVDAAILFSDILIPIEAMGIPIEFSPGPVLPQPVRTRAQVEALRVPDPEESVPFVLETLRRLRAELPPQVALIGFCGAPWTLANYAVEGGGAKEFTRMKRLLYEDPDSGELLLRKLASTNAAYLRAQIAAGAQAVQIFDSWAGILDPDDYARWALPSVQQMVREVRRGPRRDAPIIYFARDPGRSLDHLRSTGADVLSIDWRLPLDRARSALGDLVAVQGNLDPAALFAPWPVLRQRADAVLERAGNAPGHIFNLGHGILPETPVDNVRRLVDHVHARPASG